MRPPVRGSISETLTAGHMHHSVYPVRRSAHRIVERHYDEAGRLRSERVGEYVAQEWTVAESGPRDNDVSAETVDAGAAGCLSGIVSAVICLAFLIGLAVIGGAIGAYVAGKSGVAVGLIAASTLGLWWLQSGPGSRSSGP
jgi:hypothetical protein